MSSDPAEIFRQEAHELLEQLEATLLDLETRPGEMALIDTAFRALHTIKGSGAMFGYDRVASFTHHVENAFDRLRRGELAPTRQLVSVALSARDHIRQLIESPGDGAGSGADGQRIIDRLRDLTASGSASASPSGVAVASRAETQPTTYRIEMRLAADSMRMGTNPLLLLDELRTLGACEVTALTGDIPDLAELDPSESYLAWSIVLRTSQPRTAIEDVFLFVIDDMVLAIEIDGDGDGDADGVDPAVVQPAVATDLHASPPGRIGTPPGPEAPVAIGNAGAPVPAAGLAKRTADVIRVPAARLDELMDRVGELVIAQSRLRQVAATSTDPQVHAIAEDIERLALDLRDTTVGMRMMPIEALFGRFRRMVHDLADELGKRIEFVTVGEDTEIDKTVSERLGDPLVHLIRNAVDHGLETPAEREAAGKNPVGRIELSAAHAGDEIRVTITDDGRGLDRARIRARAVANGLLAEAAEPSDSALFACLFMPGFSTAQTVTNLSGRGVGMDVVKRAIEQLRGTIDISSPPEGGGTKLVLRLPLTLAIIDGLLVRVGEGRFVIPLACVEDCVELASVQVVRADSARSPADTGCAGSSLLNLRGRIVPFLRLADLFATTAPPGRYPTVVIVSAGGRLVGLVVDQIIGNHQTVIKSLSKLNASARMFSGATILGDGRVALIIEVSQLVSMQAAAAADVPVQPPLLRLAS